MARPRARHGSRVGALRSLCRPSSRHRGARTVRPGLWRCPADRGTADGAFGSSPSPRTRSRRHRGRLAGSGHRDRAFAIPAAGRGHRPLRPHGEPPARGRLAGGGPVRAAGVSGPPGAPGRRRPRRPGRSGKPAPGIRRASDPLLPLVAAAPALVARFWDLDPTGSSRRSKESDLEIRLPERGLPLTVHFPGPRPAMRRAVRGALPGT